MNPNKSIDICILDNKQKLRKEYTGLLEGLNYNVLIIDRPEQKESRKCIKDYDTHVFIISYTLGCDGIAKQPVTSEDMAERLVNGRQVAEEIRQFNKNAYIHIVSEINKTKKPFDSDLTLNQMVKKGIINSYSGRKSSSFTSSLDKIIDAVITGLRN